MTGLGPAAFRFVAECSIQLSYMSMAELQIQNFIMYTIILYVCDRLLTRGTGFEPNLVVIPFLIQSLCFQHSPIFLLRLSQVLLKILFDLFSDAPMIYWYSAIGSRLSICISSHDILLYIFIRGKFGGARIWRFCFYLTVLTTRHRADDWAPFRQYRTPCFDDIAWAFHSSNVRSSFLSVCPRRLVPTHQRTDSGPAGSRTPFRTSSIIPFVTIIAALISFFPVWIGRSGSPNSIERFLWESVLQHVVTLFEPQTT